VVTIHRKHARLKPAKIRSPQAWHRQVFWGATLLTGAKFRNAQQVVALRPRTGSAQCVFAFFCTVSVDAGLNAALFDRWLTIWAGR
jgi:hypothetical protein